MQETNHPSEKGSCATGKPFEHQVPATAPTVPLVLQVAAPEVDPAANAPTTAAEGTAMATAPDAMAMAHAASRVVVAASFAVILEVATSIAPAHTDSGGGSDRPRTALMCVARLDEGADESAWISTSSQKNRGNHQRQHHWCGAPDRAAHQLAPDWRRHGSPTFWRRPHRRR